MIKKIRMILSMATVLMVLASAAASAADDEFGVWAIASVTDVLPSAAENNPWRYTVDAQYRLVNDNSDFRQYLLRPAIGYALASGVQFWVGYGRFETDRNNGRSSFENRYWQQVNWGVGELRGGAVTARVRLEQRSVSSGGDLGHVARLMIKYVRPFAGSSNRYWAASLEPFFDLRNTDWGANKGLSQHRFAVAVGQPVSENIVVEAGYMNQYAFRDNAPDRSNHLAVVHMKMKF